MLTSTWSRYLAIAAASAAIMAAPALAAAQESASSDEEGSPSDPLKPEIESSGEDPFIDAVAEDAAESEQRGDGADAPKEYDLGKSSVTGIEREKGSSNATFEVELDQLSELPFKSAADVMQLAPGVLTTNHGGDGHAHETFMRGFYAGEGQDIEYMVDGVPLNEVSNPHGHGYTDLFFIPPMFIQTLSVTEGSFDPEQGDFAFAGSVNFKLGVPERGLRMGAGWGRFNTRRAHLVWAPQGESDGTFAGVQVYDTAGFGANRAAQRAAALARYERPRVGSGLGWSASVYGFTGRYDQPGVLRADDVEAGRIGFYETYDPAQGGESSRFLTSVNLVAGPNDAIFESTAWLGVRSMRLRQNFTGFLVPTETEEGTQYFGDLQEGRYSALKVGAKGSYTLTRRIADHAQELSVGYYIRHDRGTTELVRLRDRLQVPYAMDFDRAFDITNVSGWIRGRVTPFDLVTVTGGLRLDTFGFGTRDFNLPEEDTDGPRLPEQTIRAFGTALNPRVTTVLHLTSDLDASVAYGKGTRSTDAAALSDAETAPFAQSDQVEAGLKWRTADPDAWSFSAQGSYVYAFIERDQIFNPAAGRNILVGQSQRHAVLASGRATYKNTFDVLGNVGFAYATTIQQDETRPTFGERVLLPYIPQLVARLDASWRRDLGVSIDGVPMMLRTASGFTYVPGRPLPLGEYGDPFYLLNASIGVDLWHTTVRLEGRNLLGLQYRQSEFNYPSRFDRTVPLPASGAPRAERHFVAGEPLQVMVSVEVDVERMADASEEDVTAEPTSAQEE